MSTFSDTVTAKFATHPVLKNLPADQLKSLIDNFDTWTGLKAYGAEGLVADYSLGEANAAAVIRVANTEAAEEASEQSKPTLEVAITGSASASAATNTPAPIFGGAYAHLLQGSTSASGLSGAIMNPRIKPQFILAASKAVLSFVMTGTGVLSVFSQEFWSQMALEDFDLRAKIDNWQHDVDSGDFINTQAQQALFEGVGKLFGSRFDDLVKAVAKLSQQTRALQLVGSQANVDIGSDAADFASLADLIPLFAEELGQNMIQSRMPEQANRVIRMVNTLMEILKNTTLHQYAGVVGAPSPDEGAVMFLQKRFGPDIANKVRLALAYEALVAALAECPAPDLMAADYLKVVGVLAARLNNLFKLVAPNQEVSQTAKPFRPVDQPAYAQPQTAASAHSFISFSISLKWSRS